MPCRRGGADAVTDLCGHDEACPRAVSRYRDGIRAALAVAATVWFFGASFGLVARSAGMGVHAPLVMSATTFAGSAQFAVSSILGASGGAAAAIAAAVLLNARYAPISISVASLFHGRPPAPSRRVTTDRGRVVGALEPRRRPLRQADPGRGRAPPLRVVGQRDRWWACSSAMRSATRRTSAWTARSPRSSWRCSCRSCARRGPRSPRATGGAIALVLIPVRPRPGTPIVAASAACLLGLRRSKL